MNIFGFSWFILGNGKNHLISIFAEEILEWQIVYLGQSQDRYLAQQSLRTS